MTFKEWQASVGLAYQYKIYAPYLGLKYSDMGAHIHFTDQGTGTVYSDKKLESKNKFGIFYGIDVLLNDSMSLNMEGRNIDEDAVSAGLNARF
jgi:hypothetical protein